MRVKIGLLGRPLLGSPTGATNPTIWRQIVGLLGPFKVHPHCPQNGGDGRGATSPLTPRGRAPAHTAGLAEGEPQAGSFVGDKPASPSASQQKVDEMHRVLMAGR